jgi:hypothetical protein
MDSTQYETSTVRMMFGLVIGAAVGSLALVTEINIEMLLRGESVPPGLLVQSLGMSILVFVVFAGGMVIVGGPIWAVLHSLGRRGWLDALLLGGLSSSLVSLAIALLPLLLMPAHSTYSASEGGHDTVVNNHLTSFGWEMYLKQSALIGLAGALAGWMVWRVAYRRATIS